MVGSGTVDERLDVDVIVGLYSWGTNVDLGNLRFYLFYLKHSRVFWLRARGLFDLELFLLDEFDDVLNFILVSLDFSEVVVLKWRKKLNLELFEALLKHDSRQICEPLEEDN